MDDTGPTVERVRVRGGRARLAAATWVVAGLAVAGAAVVGRPTAPVEQPGPSTIAARSAAASIAAPSPPARGDPVFLPRRTLGEDGLVGGIVFRRMRAGSDLR